MNSKRIHVVKRGKGWASLRAGASKAGSIQESQAKAVAAATQTAKRIGGEVVIHIQDGLVRERICYDRDPCPQEL